MAQFEKDIAVAAVSAQLSLAEEETGVLSQMLHVLQSLSLRACADASVTECARITIDTLRGDFLQAGLPQTVLLQNTVKIQNGLICVPRTLCPEEGAS